MFSKVCLICCCLLLAHGLEIVSAFSTQVPGVSSSFTQKTISTRLSLSPRDNISSNSNFDNVNDDNLHGQENNKEYGQSLPTDSNSRRRDVLLSTVSLAAGTMTSGLFPTSTWAAAAEDAAAGESESFASIAARASQISKELETTPQTSTIRKTDKTIYDFELPIEGKNIPMKDIIRQENDGDNAKVKAILFVNIKQDDPVARKDIPELISLLTK